MNAKFRNAVNSNDISLVRIFLSNELLLDPRGYSFEQMLDFANLHINNIFVADDRIEYSRDSNIWNTEFLFKLKNDLDSNFSREKLVLYKDVARKVLNAKVNELNNVSTGRISDTVTRNQEIHRSTTRPLKKTEANSGTHQRYEQRYRTGPFHLSMEEQLFKYLIPFITKGGGINKEKEENIRYYIKCIIKTIFD